MARMINVHGLGVCGTAGFLGLAVLLGACAASVPPSQDAAVLQTREATRRIEIHATKPAVLSVARDVLEAEGGQVLEDPEVDGAQATFPDDVAVLVSVDTQESLARIQIRGKSRNPGADVSTLVNRLERQIRNAVEQLR